MSVNMVKNNRGRKAANINLRHALILAYACAHIHIITYTIRTCAHTHTHTKDVCNN